jgi:hypothetical protein
MLAGLASDFVSIEVSNPDYERIEVDFKVKFHSGRDKGFFTQQLREDVIRFLSPWLFEEGADLAFGGRIHRSWILNFIELREYVDFVTDFSMNHFTDDWTRTDVEEAIPSCSSGVLVSAASHEIDPEISAECLNLST